MRRPLVACLVVLAAMVPTAAAQAATVHVSTDQSNGNSHLVVVGGPKADHLTITAGDANSTVGPLDVTVSDSFRSVIPGAGCTAVGPRTAHCVADGVPNADVRTGAGNDWVHLGIAPGGDPLELVTVSLGDGEDHLSGTAAFVTGLGGPGDDVLHGGAGDDHLVGGGGHDRLNGGAGSDTLSDGDDSDRPDRDVMDGGAGALDVVDYSKRTRGVDVDLRRLDGNGQPGENDRVLHLEGVEGGTGNDHLAGTARADYFLGGGGADVIHGRGGADAVFADPGRFLLGPGRDDAVFLSFGAGAVACGTGRDLVDQVFPRHRRLLAPGPLVRSDCERLEPQILLGDGPRQRITGPFPAQPVRRHADGRLTFSLPPVSVNGFRAHRAPGRLLLIKGPRVLDRARLGPRGASRFTRRRVTVTLPGRLATAAHRHPLTVGLRLRLRGEPEIRWRVSVRLPGA